MTIEVSVFQPRPGLYRAFCKEFNFACDARALPDLVTKCLLEISKEFSNNVACLESKVAKSVGGRVWVNFKVEALYHTCHSCGKLDFVSKPDFVN